MTCANGDPLGLVALVLCLQAVLTFVLAYLILGWRQ